MRLVGDARVTQTAMLLTNAVPVAREIEPVGWLVGWFDVSAGPEIYPKPEFDMVNTTRPSRAAWGERNGLRNARARLRSDR